MFRKKNIFIGIVSSLVLFGSIEAFVRSDFIAQKLLFTPLAVSNKDTVNAKVTALANYSGSASVLLGDSVALGQLMGNHGFSNWRENELSSALNTKIQSGEKSFRVFNFAANGYTLADMSWVMRRLPKHKINSIILVIGLRAFSKDFEEREKQYTLDIGDKSSTSIINKLVSNWQSLNVITHGLYYLIGGPPNQVVSKIRRMCLTSECNRKKERSKDTLNMIQILKMRQRYSNVVIGENQSYQSDRFLNSIKYIRESGVPVLVVYATENPQLAESLISAQLLTKHRKSLENLVRNVDENILYLPPNGNLNKEMFLDSVHLNPTGYQKVAEQVFPFLTGAISSN